MSTALVQRQRHLLPAFNMLLATGAAVLSVIAISADHAGSTTSNSTKSAVTVTEAVCGLKVNTRC